MPLPVLTNNGGVLTGSGRCSEFGVDDPEDNGVGAWGYPTGDNPLAPFCSLPIPYVSQYKLMPGQKVTVEYKGRQVECFLADKGPSERLGRIIDLCPSVLKRLNCQTDSIVKIFVPLGTIVPPEKRC